MPDNMNNSLVLQQPSTRVFTLQQMLFQQQQLSALSLRFSRLLISKLFFIGYLLSDVFFCELKKWNWTGTGSGRHSSRIKCTTHRHSFTDIHMRL